MGRYDDPLLTYLRRGEYPGLTRFKGMDESLFVGPKGEVAAVLKSVLESPNIKTAESIVDAAESEKKESPFTLDDTPKSLAYYSAANIEKLYAKVGEAITSSRPLGLKSLTQLIASHLHLTWQNIFTSGIAVPTNSPSASPTAPNPRYQTAAPKPPQLPPLRRLPAHEVYTIGAVPHPYTISTLDALKSKPNISWIRRESPRDAWITALTSSLFPETISTTPRLLRFKEAVASDEDAPQEGKGAKGKGTKGGAARSLWLPAEQAIPKDIEWHFGFAIPDLATYADQQSADAVSDEVDTTDVLPPLHASKDGPIPTQDELSLELPLLHRAQAIVLSGTKSEPQPRFASLPKIPESQPEPKPQQPRGDNNPADSPETKDKEDKTQPQHKFEDIARAKANHNHDNNNKVTTEDLHLRDASEAWNLADTEAWRFTRAYLARKGVERRKWEGRRGSMLGAGSEGSD
ncbi:hypothetical protein N0V88_000020 [Collariella sp. IMI 366227]|nr:hypothetical protein N0V88_000020 [Collariella sp. IMI 366227]